MVKKKKNKVQPSARSRFGVYFTNKPIRLKSGNLGFKLPKKLAFSKKEVLGYKQVSKELSRIRKINSGNDYTVGLYHKGLLIRSGNNGINGLLNDIEFEQEMKRFEREHH